MCQKYPYTLTFALGGWGRDAYKASLPLSPKWVHLKAEAQTPALCLVTFPEDEY